MEKEKYISGLRTPILSGKIDIVKEYNEAKENGICKCKNPLAIFPGSGLSYCMNCKKEIIN